MSAPAWVSRVCEAANRTSSSSWFHETFEHVRRDELARTLRAQAAYRFDGAAHSIDDWPSCVARKYAACADYSAAVLAWWALRASSSTVLPERFHNVLRQVHAPALVGEAFEDMPGYAHVRVEFSDGRIIDAAADRSLDPASKPGQGRPFRLPIRFGWTPDPRKGAALPHFSV